MLRGAQDRGNSGTPFNAGAEEAAEKGLHLVILSAAKNLALRVFKTMRDPSFVSLRTACGSSAER